MGGSAPGGEALKFTDEQIRRACGSILSRWKAKGLVRPKGTDEAILARMAAEIRKDIRREEELDREADALLEQHLKKIDHTQANTRVLFQKIKERLARDRGIVL
ncbi:MAG: DUF507 family protein [Deltaproteobacteria bacterium]|nr:MAG: DUF507 family protein [Deltaproteobacteria bacterium]